MKSHFGVMLAYTKGMIHRKEFQQGLFLNLRNGSSVSTIYAQRGFCPLSFTQPAELLKVS